MAEGWNPIIDDVRMDVCDVERVRNRSFPKSEEADLKTKVLAGEDDAGVVAGDDDDARGCGIWIHESVKMGTNMVNLGAPDVSDSSAPTYGQYWSREQCILNWENWTSCPRVGRPCKAA